MTNTISFPGLSVGPFEINPIATPESFPLEIRWYGIVIMIGMILGVIYASWRAKQSGIKTDDLLDYVIFAVPVGIICARLYYVIFDPKGTYETFKDVIAIWEGGIAIYGGIIGGFFTMLAVSKVKKMNFLKVIDCFAPGLMIGQMLGRWGNFFNAEAYGDLSKASFPFIGDIATPIFENDYIFRMHIEGKGSFHPTFLYESLWILAGLIIIHCYFKNKKFNGEIALIYASWYGFGRFFIESLRTDSLTGGSSFRVSQILALLCVIAGITVIIIGRQKAKARSLVLDGYISQFSEPDEKKTVSAKTEAADAASENEEKTNENNDKETEGENENGNNN